MQGGILSELPKFILESVPDGDPVTIQEAKDYLRLTDDFNEHNDLIISLISAATAQAETFTRRKLISQQWSIYWDGFPPLRRLELMLVPFISLDKFEYLDQATGIFKDMDTGIYDTDDRSLVPAIMLNSLVPMWPLTKYLTINSVHVKVTCGYGDASDVPAGIKMAILRMVSSWYDSSSDLITGITMNKVPFTAERLLMPYKIFSF